MVSFRCSRIPQLNNGDDVKMNMKIAVPAAIIMLVVAIGLSYSKVGFNGISQDPSTTSMETPASKPTPAELVPRITVEELLAKTEGGASIVIVDARPKAEYDAGHIKGAISAPLSVIVEGKWVPPAGKEVVFY